MTSNTQSMTPEDIEKHKDYFENYGKKTDEDCEELLLAQFNAWLDSMRFDNRLTEEEQDTCWDMLNIVHKIQERME